MKNLTYILLTLFLFLSFSIFVLGQTPTTTIRYYATPAAAPTTCVESNRKQSLIYIAGFGLKKCVGTTYLFAEGSGSGGSGTVTSVGLSLPSIFNIITSPITTSGSLTADLANQTGNVFFASPALGTLGTPLFRSIVSADIPVLDAAKITTGIFPAARLGTGIANTTTFLRGDGTYATPAGGGTGGGDAIIANGLGQFASTTSLALAGVLSNETGTGSLVFADSPTLTTPRLAAILNGTATITVPTTTGTLALTSQITGTNSGTNTGDETSGTIQSKLGITTTPGATLSGNNTGDQFKNVPEFTVIGKGIGAGAAIPLTLGTGLSISGTTLSSSGGGGPAGTVAGFADSAAYATLEGAITAIGSSKITLLLTSNLSCSTAATVPANMLIADGGGTITKGTGCRVLFAGYGLVNPRSDRAIFVGFSYKRPSFSGAPVVSNADSEIFWTSATDYPKKIHTALFANPTASQRINMADRAFIGIGLDAWKAANSRVVEIVASPGFISEQVDIHANHNLTLQAGHFYNNYATPQDIPTSELSGVRTDTRIVASGQPIDRTNLPDFQLNDNVTVKGAGQGVTFVHESTASRGGYPLDVNGFPTTISDKGATQIFYARNVLYTVVADQFKYLTTNKNINVTDMTIVGEPTQPTQQNFSAIFLGNTHTSVMARIHFDHVSGFSAYVGIQSNQGAYAKDSLITECLFENGGSQAAGSLNGDGLLISNNIFKDEGPFKGLAGSQSYSNFIDLEPNDWHSIIDNTSIIGNQFIASGKTIAYDANGTRLTPYLNVMFIQATAISKIRNVLIEGNQIVGNFVGQTRLLNGSPTPVRKFDVGIQANGVENLTIRGNSISGTEGFGLDIIGSSLVTIDNNTFIETGGIVSRGTSDMIFERNKFLTRVDGRPTYGSTTVSELSGNTLVKSITTLNGVATLTFSNSSNTIFDYWVGKTVNLEGGGIPAGDYVIASTNFDTGVEDKTATINTGVLGNSTSGVSLTTKFPGNNKYIDNLNATYAFLPHSNAVPVDNTDSNAKVRNITASETLTRFDIGKIINVNSATAVTITVPSGLPAGFNVTIAQIGAGQVTVVGSGATLNNRNGLKTAGQFAVLTAASYSPNTYIVGGDTAP